MAGHFFVALSTFVITNVDDLLILTFYFSSRKYKTTAVVAGQFIGIIILILVSLAGLVIKEIIPHHYVGLLGIFPILIGVKELLDRSEPVNNEPAISNARRGGTWAVAMVTLANGGDNIGVYTPLFLKTEPTLLPFYCGVFLLMTAVFCYLGYYFVNHPMTKDSVSRFGNLIMPYFLILLGLWILSDFF